MKAATIKNARNGHDLASDWLKIKSAFTDTACDVKGKAGMMLSESVDDIRKKSIKVQGNISTYVTKKPVKSLGIAMLVGFALGYLLRR